ncbi:MAG: STAS domain-containing protein [Chloroflexota bacterium]
MEISVQEYKRVAVVTIRGRVDSATSGELENALRSLLERGQYNLVLDLDQVEFLSSSGLRVLVSALKSVRSAGGELCLARPAEQAADAIAIAGLDALFKTYADREAAIASF